jgi:hypothetical protein
MKPLVAAVVVLVPLLVLSHQADAVGNSADPCTRSVELESASTSCMRDDSLETVIPAEVGPEVTLEPICGSRGTGRCERVCRDWEGRGGIPYWVVIDGERSHTICRVYESGDDEEEVLTPALVWSAFEELEWPSSELVVQPPGGRTLVNFETNFLTGNDSSHRQVVSLLGQRVEIEAVPESYVWHFGDEVVRSTESPGAVYPDLVVTHRYRTKGVVRPRVDTVYVGRFRVDEGPWVEIPSSLTVEGAVQELEVVGARPVLVAPDA